MKIIRGLKYLYPEPGGVVITLGNFDGLHLGHQRILNMLTSRARALSVKSMVFTFEPHPLKVIAPERCPPLLTTFHERMSLFQRFNLDVVLFAHFTEEFASQHPQDFVRNVLVELLKVKEIYVGYNYTFGRGKSGTVAMLQELSRQYSFRVQIVDEIRIQGERISSTAIREYIRQGNMEKANLFLGRPYTLMGKVIHGAGRGKNLGFPTANIDAGKKLIPKFGVYLVRIHIQGKAYNGLANIGPKPTFGDLSPGVEVYIFHLRADLYQEVLEIELIKRIRDEIYFPNPGGLVKQIEKDVKEAMIAFEGESKGEGEKII